MTIRTESIVDRVLAVAEARAREAESQPRKEAMTASLSSAAKPLSPSSPLPKPNALQEAIEDFLRKKQAEAGPLVPARKEPPPEPVALDTWEPGLLQRLLTALVNIFKRALGLVAGVIAPKAAPLPSDAPPQASNETARDPKDVQIEELKVELLELKRQLADAKQQLEGFKRMARAFGAEASEADVQDAWEKEMCADRAVAALEEDVAAREARALALDRARDARRTAAERAAAAVADAVAAAAADARRQEALRALNFGIAGDANRVLARTLHDDSRDQADDPSEIEIERPKG